MKRRISILFILALFLLISCGIPYIFIVDKSDVTINSTKPDETENPIVSRTIITINRDELLTTDQKGNSPDINFIYVVEPVDGASKYSSLVGKFSDDFLSSTNGYSFNKTFLGPAYTAEYNNLTYGLYCLRESNESLFDVRTLDTNQWTLDFSFDQTTEVLSVIVNNNTAVPVILNRFNNRNFSIDNDYPFYGNEVNEALSESNTSGQFIVKVYAFVSFNFADKYTNIANTSISYQEPVFSFTI